MANLDQIEQLLGLIDDRDQTAGIFNQTLIEILQPTLLSALTQLLDLPAKQVEWKHMLVQESNLVLSVELLLYTNTIQSEFFKLIAPLPPTDKHEKPLLVKKVLYVAVPIEQVFQSVDSIKQYLLTAAKEAAEPIKETGLNLHFAPISIADDQLLMLSYLQQITPHTLQ